jgi:hypothetical protein
MWTFPGSVCGGLVWTDVSVADCYKAMLRSKFMPHPSTQSRHGRILWSWLCT